MNQYILVGKIVGVHGLKGDLKIKSWTALQSDILNYSHWFIGENKTKVQFKTKSNLQNKIIVQISGISDISIAESIVHQDIFIEKSQLNETSEDEFYWQDLINCKVENTQKVLFGKVSEVFDNGAHSILVVQACSSSIDEEKRLIPFVKNYVVKVDLKEQLIIVDWQVDY